MHAVRIVPERNREIGTDGSTTIEPVTGARNSTRFPIYARLDLRTGRDIVTRRGGIRVELSIVNVTDRDNACCVDEFRFALSPG